MGKYIYLITVLSKLDYFARVVSILVETALIFLILTCILFYFKICDDEEGKVVNACKSWIKGLAIILSICATINILVPSKEEMYMIYATKYVTKENLQMTKDEIKNTTDYIFEKFKELKEDK
ncbi:hypothetical protein [Peptostreptococcus porci]|uniref:hypothetical protein n=1 Tax=Peptostreptococcus porci TaxID=2652282 RepID=UPI002A9188AC|nr:hypothetical protein [Peptostreptococcus porci]MDY6232807.1 hypothetical protein [Peptostreptococcus porci]